MVLITGFYGRKWLCPWNLEVSREFAIFAVAYISNRHDMKNIEKFYMQRYILDGTTGAYVADGEARSLEDDFGNIRYKSITGLNSIGKQKGVYTESYPESDSERTYADPEPRVEGTTSTLTVYSFGFDTSAPASIGVREQIKAMESGWRDLLGFIQGAHILWKDYNRELKALFLLKEAVEPTTDNTKGTPYLECGVKLDNIFGKAFPMDSTTIEDWLKNGGKEVSNG